MQYPLAFDYLSSNEERIKATVNCREGEYWHTFTREHNQTMYNVPKIIVPMTARDTIATFVPSTGLYMDNANVWFMTVEGADEIEDSEIGAFYLNGEAFCKRLQHINAITYLVSDNDTYSPIQIKSDDELKLFGKVIDVVNNV